MTGSIDRAESLMVIDSMSRRTRSLRRGLPATIRSPISSLVMAALLSATGSAAVPGNAQLDGRLVTAALVAALDSTPAQVIMPTIFIEE